MTNSVSRDRIIAVLAEVPWEAWALDGQEGLRGVCRNHFGPMADRLLAEWPSLAADIEHGNKELRVTVLASTTRASARGVLAHGVLAKAIERSMGGGSNIGQLSHALNVSRLVLDLGQPVLDRETAGLCPACGQGPPEDGYSVCGACAWDPDQDARLRQFNRLTEG